MSQVIEILKSLGVDTTVYYQFAIFFIAFFSMKTIVFKPYLDAHDERKKRTVGGEKEAVQLLAEAEEKENKYSKLAKDLNGKIKQIFSEQNTKAKKESEKIMAQAKKEVDERSEKTRKELEQSVSEARAEIETYIPAISENIEKKFVGN